MDERTTEGLYEVEPGQMGFRATLMEGPDIDLAALAGFPEDDPVVQRAWDSADWEMLLRQCLSAEVLDEADLTGDEPPDEIPGMSDAWFVVRIDDAATFTRELRAAFLVAANEPEKLE